MSFATEPPSTPAVLPFAHPLDEFYAHAGLEIPRIEIVPGETLPQPCRQLLVHEGDMTPTLEKFYESTLHVEVLHREQRGDFYFREVVLVTDDDARRVEFGAIKIYLALFPRAARAEILAEKLPLGTILAKYRIPHTSRPKAFLKVHSDALVNRALGLTGSHLLCGRRNTLSNPEQQALAEIVEILPPASAQ